jgi:hypothetical protein
MTLQNGFIRGDSAYLYSDTAFHDLATGQLLGQFAKVYSLPTGFPCAVSLTTIGGMQNELVDKIGYSVTLDGILEQCSKSLRAYCAAGHLARMLVAAYYDGPRLFLIAYDSDKLPSGGEPFVPVEMTHVMSSGNDLPEYAAMIAAGFSTESVDAFHEAQISHGMTYDDAPDHLRDRRNWFGGQLCEVAVSGRGVELNVIHEIANQ